MENSPPAVGIEVEGKLTSIATSSDNSAVGGSKVGNSAKEVVKST